MEEMKREHDWSMFALDRSIRENPKALFGWINGHLSNGKIIILPPAIYDKAIDLCREYGLSDKAIENIHKSSYL